METPDKLYSKIRTLNEHLWERRVDRPQIELMSKGVEKAFAEE